MLYGLPEVPTNKGKKGFEANSLELQSPSATLCLPHQTGSESVASPPLDRELMQDRMLSRSSGISEAGSE